MICKQLEFFIVVTNKHSPHSYMTGFSAHDFLWISYAAQVLLSGDRPPIRYDVLSINIGSAPKVPPGSGLPIMGVPLKSSKFRQFEY